MDAIVKTLEEEAAEELYLESVHEATNASHNGGTAFGEAMTASETHELGGCELTTTRT